MLLWIYLMHDLLHLYLLSFSFHSLLFLLMQLFGSGPGLLVLGHLIYFNAGIISWPDNEDEDQPSCPKVLVNSSYYFSWLASTDGLVRFRAVTKSILVITPISS